MVEIRGGNKMEAALQRIAAKLSSKPTLRVGFLEGATYPDGTPVALVAAVNDFGSAHSPPRPFFRNMVHVRQYEWAPVLALALRSNNYDIRVSLSLLGEVMRGQLQEAIRDFSGTPLAPATVARKGFDKQLIDKAHMINSADYEIKE